MAYEVSFTDAVNKGIITVDENTPNTETSLTLIGRNLADYGKLLNENFLHLLENFANDTPPVNPIEGQTWYDTTNGINQLKIYDGAQWVSAGGLNKSSKQPSNEVSNVGDIWVDTSNQQLYIYTGSGWVLVGPDYSQGSNSGTKFETITSTANIANEVVTTYVSGVPITIISNTEFRPKATIQGFNIIKPGVNLSSLVKFYGLVEKAENVLVNGIAYPGSDFARLSAANIFEQSIRVRNNRGIGVGETETLNLSITGSNALISNKSNDGYIDIKVNNTLTAIRASFDGKVGILNESPQEALDVFGNFKVSGHITSTGTVDSSSINDGAATFAGGVGIAKNLNVGGNLVVENNITAAGITPIAGTTPNLGSITSKYNEIYATTYFGDTFRGDFIGNVSGNSSSAAKLNSLTEFTFVGDIELETPVQFDGATGGLQKTFNTKLKDTFFVGKPEYTDNISRTEQILIFKTGTGPGDTLPENNFYTATVEKIVSVVPTFQLGMIMPYAGEVAPAGWILCDGRSLARTQYENLFQVIGTRYGSPTPLEFRVPDLRGRMPLGYLDGVIRDNPADEDRVYDDPAANILGADGGAQRIWITEDNLPNHSHNLVDETDGTTYFAITNVTGTAGISTNLTGTSPGSGVIETGGLVGGTTNNQTVPGYNTPQDVGEKINTVSPYVTVNYIIYSGA